ncbi:MAG: hypothetical protein JWO86_553 [Myxococcaceae bacterium]|jgi:hypothetical protein|nr:hypothetical protein [Myxococcaceae bacterium]MEA2749296.1 hypothetical protein [Myxococcales bacterium]
MQVKRAPKEPSSDPSLAATREVDSVSLLAAELLLDAEADDALSVRRAKASLGDAVPGSTRPPNGPSSARATFGAAATSSGTTSTVPVTPWRRARSLGAVGGIVILVTLTGAAVFFLMRS